MAVYRASTGSQPQSQTDEICVSTKEGYLYFLETKMTASGIQFQLTDKQHEIKFRPSQLYWDDDKIFMCSQKGYMILSKRSGEIIAKLE